MASPAKDIPLMPTVEEARAAQAHSRAYLNMMRTCGALVHVLKAVEPFLEDTPFKTPLAVLTAIADVVEVRLITVTDPSVLFSHADRVYRRPSMILVTMRKIHWIPSLAVLLS